MCVCVFQHGQSSDAGFISLVIMTLLKQLQHEHRGIKQLQQLSVEYKELTVCLEPWLTEHPDVTPLKNIRKTIKGLKSKLRHKLADKQDLEEVH